MVEIERKEVKISSQFDLDIIDVFSYGEATFMHPECRYLKSKNKIYRNIILGTYLIIYRITKSRIEVLRIIRSEVSIQKLKAVRKLKI